MPSAGMFMIRGTRGNANGLPESICSTAVAVLLMKPRNLCAAGSVAQLVHGEFIYKTLKWQNLNPRDKD